MTPLNTRVTAAAAVCVLVGLCGGGGYLLARRRAADRRAATPAVATHERRETAPSKSHVTTAVAPSDEPFLGLLLAHDQVNIAAKLDARIDKVFFRLGDHVRQNDILCVQDARELKRSLQMADAAIQASRAEEDKAGLELDQASDRLQRRLALGKGGVSAEDLESAKYQEKLDQAHLSTTRATTAEKRAHRDQLREQLRDTEIRAPFDGQIAARFVDPGTLVAHGTPLMRLISDRGLWLRFAVPQERADSIKTGAHVHAVTDELGLPVEGIVEKVAPEVDAASQMIFVEARIVGQDERQNALAGRVARVRLVPSR